jgi:hypothetical protein
VSRKVQKIEGKARNRLGESGTENARPGASRTQREQTRRVWNRKRADQESLEPKKSSPGESGTGIGKREDQGSLEPEERRRGESGTGRKKKGKV